MVSIICTAASCTIVFGLAIWLGRISAKYDFASRIESLEENVKELEFELEEIRNEKRKEAK